MVDWQIVYTKQAQRDARKLKSAGLKEKAQELLHILERNPFQTPPPYGGVFQHQFIILRNPRNH